MGDSDSLLSWYCVITLQCNNRVPSVLSYIILFWIALKITVTHVVSGTWIDVTSAGKKIHTVLI